MRSKTSIQEKLEAENHRLKQEITELKNRQAVEDRRESAAGPVSNGLENAGPIGETPLAVAGELHRYFSDSLDLLCIADTDGYFRRLNKEWETTLGYSIDELKDQRFLDFVHPEDRDATLRAVEDLRTQKEVLNFVNRYRCKDGNYRWIEWRSYSSGKIIYAVARDVTERKRAEQALRESEDRFTSFMRHLPGFAYLKDHNRRILYVNERFESDFGIPTRDWIGRTNDEIWPGDVGEIIKRDDLNVLLTGRPLVTTEEVPTRGEMHTFRTIKFPIPRPEGRPWLGGVSVDITEQQETEKALRKFESMTRSMIESIPIGMHMYRLDSGERLVFEGANPAADKILGVDNGLFVGKTIEEAFPALTKTEVPQRYREAAGQGRPWHSDMIFYNEGGIEGAYEVYAFQIAPHRMAAAFSEITERRRAEKALRDSEYLLRKTQEVGVLGSYSFDSLTGEWIGSPMLDQIFGIDAGYPKSVDGWIGLVHPDEKNDMHRYLCEYVIAGHQRFDKEYRIVRISDGQTRWVHGQGELEFDAEGRAVKMIGTIQDITKRMQAEESLRRANRQLRMISDCNQALIRIEGEPELLTAVCSIAVQVGGYRMAWVGFAEEDESKSVRPVAHAGFEDNYLQKVRVRWADSELGRGPVGTAIRSGRPCAVQDVSSDPRFRPWQEEAAARGYASACSLPLVINNRAVGALSLYSPRPGTFDAAELDLLTELSNDLAFGISVLRARAEQKRSEEALRTSEERFKRLVQNSSDIIAILDAGFVPVAISGPLEKVVGFRAEELVGAASFGTVHPDDQDMVAKTLAEMAGQPGSTRRIEYRFRHKNGSWIAVEAVGTNLLSDPFVKGIVLNIRDISERKKLQEQLQQAMKMEAVGRLSGGVAHDFNNLLTVISGNLELTKMELSQSDPLIRNLDEAAKAASSAASLTRQLLAFSRRQIIEPKVLNLNDLIENVKKMLGRLIGEDIELQTELCENLGSVKIDPGQFEQVLVNLAVNARDAMPRGGRLLVETRNVDLDEAFTLLHPEVKPGKYVKLAMTDSGHGMSDEVKEHIFEPFFTTKHMGHGTGLGLATTFGAVQQAGGIIEVFSEMGAGTTFNIYLPLIQRPAEKLAAEKTSLDQARGEGTVLLVEDDSSVRNLAVMILKKLGYNVLQARSGEEAFLLAEKNVGQIDLLMTDVVMPGMNGRELAQAMLKMQPGMNVLFTSGYTDDRIMHHGVIDEKLNFISKPYSLQLLAKKVREILDPGQK